MAATDLGKVGIVMKGAWSSSATYEELDAVYYNSNTYIAKQAVPANTDPTNTTYWQIALDSQVKPTIISETHEFTSSSTTSYTGVSITIPAGKSFAIRADAQYNTKEPKEIYLVRSDSSIAEKFRIMAGGEVGSCSVSGYAAANITLYVWAKYGGAGSNTIGLYGFYF